MAQQFADKVILVTGAAAGIGAVTAKAFAEQGGTVILADISKQGEVIAAGIREAGGQAVFLQCNVSSEEAVSELMDLIVSTYGKLDVAFNNAGVEFEAAKLADGNMDAFNKIMDINVKGVWLCMKYEIQHMLKTGGGAIVNTASIAGLGAAPTMSIYSASKHAVIGLTKSAAIEYAKKGIRVNAVCPAVIDTDMFRRAVEADPRKADFVKATHPVGRLGKAEEIAAAVLYLSSDAAAFTTGVAMPVDGGATAI